MAQWLDKISDRNAANRWERQAKRVDTLPPGDLTKLRDRTLGLRRSLSRLSGAVECRLEAPLGPEDVLRSPPDADWAWRPGLFSRALELPGAATLRNGRLISEDAKIFHDCLRSELCLRQVRTGGESDLSPFGLSLDVFHFDGSFLSLVIDLPHEAIDGLTANHLIGFSIEVKREYPLELFARLNLKHGPNTANIVRSIPAEVESSIVEFDLAYAELDDAKITGAWVDLIIDAPEMNRLTIHDITLYRRLRAPL